MESRVVITGYGCLTAAGHDVTATWASMTSGSSGIEQVTSWDSSSWRSAIAGEIKDYNPRKLVADRKLLKVITRQDVIGLNAVDQAMAHSGLPEYRAALGDDCESLNDRTGIFVGSPGNKYHHQHDYLTALASASGDQAAFGSAAMDEVHPMWLLRTLPNNVLAYAGIRYGFKGANENITAHGISGAQAILEACRYLRDGTIDRAIVVGYDSAIEAEALAYYSSVGLLSAESIKPFDANRDGTVLGEGAGCLILETPQAAEQRAAIVYGEVLGGSVVSESQGVLSIREDGDGVRRAVQSALRNSRLKPQDIGMITAHANGTGVSDASEARAYLEMFGSQAVPVTGFKWSLGHTIAASGVIESILTLLCLREGWMPGISTLKELAPECAGLSVSTSKQKTSSKLGLVVCRSFASLNSAIVLSAHDG
ncbi:MAG: 3-oxoacyl-ACP synthase [bacterium]|nr:3-oxoacyl-ACP synthase [bacterium]